VGQTRLIRGACHRPPTRDGLQLRFETSAERDEWAEALAQTCTGNEEIEDETAIEWLSAVPSWAAPASGDAATAAAAAAATTEGMADAIRPQLAALPRRQPPPTAPPSAIAAMPPAEKQALVERLNSDLPIEVYERAMDLIHATVPPDAAAADEIELDAIPDSAMWRIRAVVREHLHSSLLEEPPAPTPTYKCKSCEMDVANKADCLGAERLHAPADAFEAVDEPALDRALGSRIRRAPSWLPRLAFTDVQNCVQLAPREVSGIKFGASDTAGKGANFTIADLRCARCEAYMGWRLLQARAPADAFREGCCVVPAIALQDGGAEPSAGVLAPPAPPAPSDPLDSCAFQVVGCTGMPEFDGYYDQDSERPERNGKSCYRKRAETLDEPKPEQTVNFSSGSWYMCHNHSGSWFQVDSRAEFPPQAGWVQGNRGRGDPPTLIPGGAALAAPHGPASGAAGLLRPAAPPARAAARAPPQPAAMAAAMPAAPPAADGVYHWQKDDRGWEPYPPDVQEQLRAARREGRDVVRVRLGPGGRHAYDIDLGNNRQVNAQTGNHRAIHVAPAGTMPAPVRAPPRARLPVRVTAEQVTQLQMFTAAGEAVCRAALERNGGDLERSANYVLMHADGGGDDAADAEAAAAAQAAAREARVQQVRETFHALDQVSNCHVIFRCVTWMATSLYLRRCTSTAPLFPAAADLIYI
jgi:hypothetical protein